MHERLIAEREVTLLDLLDRILDKGVIISGDITISVANVDLIYLGLRLLLTSVDNLPTSRAGQGGGDTWCPHAPPAICQSSEDRL
ncbi:MAG: gas vesicle protein GvpJ [Oscillochloridaceae bacterium]|nr:gas vesicle protein [Chloroflexaceae bacterium]MDW8388686.1 gas vesicle protein GvpJ [Oscillochloridaceae bacterium]